MSSPVVTLNGPLTQGSTGPDVQTLQAALNNATPPAGLVVDGKFGPKTDKALRDFQRRRAIKPDGIAGPDTAKALGMAYIGSSGDPVRIKTAYQQAAIADAIARGLEKIKEAARKDILKSGASKVAIKQAMDDLDNFAYSDAFDTLEGRGTYVGLGLNRSWDPSRDANADVVRFALRLAIIATYVQDQGKGNVHAVKRRIEAIDSEAIGRIVKRVVEGTIVGGLETALWEINALLWQAWYP